MMALNPPDRPAGYRELIEQFREILGQVRAPAH